MEVFFALAVAGGAIAYKMMKRGEKHARWKDVFEEAANKLGGRASTGTRFDSPELRATVDQISIDVKLKSAYKRTDKGVAVAEASLSGPCTSLRLYFGWDVGPVRRELEYIPEIPFPRAFGLRGRVSVRSDDADLANRFVQHAVNDLSDVRREAEAHGVEILVRGGTFRMAVHGIQRSSWMIERIVTAMTRLVRGVEHFAGGSLPPPSARPLAPVAPRGPDAAVPAPAEEDDGSFEEATCTLCTEARKARSGWVRCNRCGAAYHHRCWAQATGCLSEGCEETSLG